MMTYTTRSAPLLALLVLLSGCGPKRMEPVESVSSGGYEIQVMAPGGAFKSGENPVALHLLREGQSVTLRQAVLIFATTPPDAAAPLQAEARLTPDADSTGLAGTVVFGREGTWTAQLAAVTETGPVTGTFEVRIE